jgi:hypothetical protein
MEGLFREERDRDTKLLASGANAGKAGSSKTRCTKDADTTDRSQDCIMYAQ